MIMTELNIIV